MISDEEVKELFVSKLDIPDIVTGLFKLKAKANNTGYRLDEGFSLQVCRGLPPHLWKDAPKHGCSRCMAVFEGFNVIPQYCFDCYKVLITPRTVLELFKLLMTYENIKLPNDNTRKCMIETRSYSSGVYKGFVYCRTLDEGNEVLQSVRQAVSDNISAEIPVTLKRGCSEYAQVYPDTDNWQYGKDWQFYETFVDESFVFEGPVDASGDSEEQEYSMRELFAMQFWLRYAATIGDMSYLSMTGGEKLAPLPKQQM